MLEAWFEVSQLILRVMPLATTLYFGVPLLIRLWRFLRKDGWL